MRKAFEPTNTQRIRRTPSVAVDWGGWVRGELKGIRDASGGGERGNGVCGGGGGGVEIKGPVMGGGVWDMGKWVG